MYKGPMLCTGVVCLLVRFAWIRSCGGSSYPQPRLPRPERDSRIRAETRPHDADLRTTTARVHGPPSPPLALPSRTAAVVVYVAISSDMSAVSQQPQQQQQQMGSGDPCSPTTKRTGSAMSSPVSKKVKMSAEERAREKAVRELDKAAEKALREAEKAQREADKANKEAEKEAKRLEREESKRVRDEAKAKERRQKEDERLQKEEARLKERQLKDEARAREQAALEKKERNQLRMVNFFKKTDPRPPPILAKEESSIFKPFHMKENTILAQRRSICPLEVNSFVESISGAHPELPPSIDHTLDLARHRKRLKRGCYSRTPKLTLRQRLVESSSTPLEQRLKSTRYKLLQFHQDVRPPYFGTMTSTATARGLATGRKPYARTVELDYDYDSEADWIQGEDEDAGEELGEDEDDVSVNSRDTYGDDDDDFLDDEDVETGDARERRRQNGTLLPLLMGIFTPEDCEPVAHLKLQKLVDTELPIDPFENYWDPVPVATSGTTALTCTTRSLNGTVPVARPDVPMEGKKMAKKRSAINGAASSSFPEHLVSEFRKAVVGSTQTKILLVEKLRVQFKAQKVSKKAIEDKLVEVAHRQGKGQHDVWTWRE